MRCANGGVAVDGIPKDGIFTCDCSRTSFVGKNCELGTALCKDLFLTIFPVADCRMAGKGGLSCSQLNREPCTTQPQTCGQCKDGFSATDDNDPNSNCQEGSLFDLIFDRCGC